jgi:hypothetical protein
MTDETRASDVEDVTVRSENARPEFTGRWARPEFFPAVDAVLITPENPPRWEGVWGEPARDQAPSPLGGRLG